MTNHPDERAGRAPLEAVAHPEAAVQRQIEADREMGTERCALDYCGHMDTEHRTEMFVGEMIAHDWCFTCHHLTHHALRQITREQAHHAFARLAAESPAPPVGGGA